jgi:hypothetical protein
MPLWDPKAETRASTFAGRHPADVSLHDHGVEGLGLVDPPTGLQDRGQKLPARSFGISSSRSPTWVVRVRGR